MNRNIGSGTNAGLGLISICLCIFALCLYQTGFAQSAIDQLPGSVYVPPASPPSPPPEDNSNREEPAQPEQPHSSPAPKETQRPKEQAPVWTDIFGLGYVPQEKLGFKSLLSATMSVAVPVQPPLRVKGPVARAEGEEISAAAKKVASEYDLPEQLHNLPGRGKLTPEEWRAWFNGSRVKYSMDADVVYPDESGIGIKPDGTRCSDCSHFVWDVLTREGLDVPYVTAQKSDLWIGNSPRFEKIEPPNEPQPGDVILGDNEHMGIYAGKDSRGRYTGTQMGNHGAKTISWGPRGSGFPAAQLDFYRPIRDQVP